MFAAGIQTLNRGVRSRNCRLAVMEMKAATMVSFWLKGSEARRKGLQTEFEKRLAQLQSKLQDAISIDEQLAINEAIREATAAHARRLAGIHRMLH